LNNSRVEEHVLTWHAVVQPGSSRQEEEQEALHIQVCIGCFIKKTSVCPKPFGLLNVIDISIFLLTSFSGFMAPGCCIQKHT
jgi:hypothetical protein